ncbi:murein biosynthesis integral membrane protein MurJ [Clostridium cylindrosporum]|uniref:Probable lipid II flippase MurJ n=1 Tax=Clostridium cylindrosporum DSM 605 TaxID=1121307 RepID=A0A0J8D7B7_CLOCY|nr:murein biosynthesis integral membrane protein MurJ [Clostridium cylindrosporum]KMT21792.1 protein MurJ [Clostridium cylindrosporum DSM 605]
MRKTAILLMLATVLSKILGLFREIFLAYFYGITDVKSAYGIALSIPGTVFALIGAGIATGYIPIYSRIENEADTEQANRFTSNIINFTMLICTILVILVLIFPNPVVKLFAVAFEGKVLDITVTLTRFTIIGVYFTALVYIFSAYLNLKNTFIIPALVGIPMNICVLFSIALSSKTGIEVLGLGTLISIFVQVIFLLPFIKKTGYKHRFILDKKDKYLKKMIVLAVPVIIGISANQVNLIVDKNIASTLSIKAVGAIDYGMRLNGFVQGLFVMSIVTAMYPMISKMGSENNIDGLKDSLKEAIISVSLLVIPVSVLAMIFSEPVIKLLFERGKFNSSDTLITSGVLFFYSIGMIGYGLREVISKAFYSLHDTKTPMINAVVAVVINIILCIILSRFMGVNGLALATSIAGILCTITLFISLRRKIGYIKLKSILISLCKIGASAIAMGCSARLVLLLLTPIIGETLALIVAVLIAIVVYSVTLYLMKIEEVNSILDMFKNKLKLKNSI